MLTLITRRRRTAARKVTLLALAAALTVAAPAVDARPGGGGSMGSRGSNTFNAPAATPTAPGGGMSMQRSQTAPSPGMTNPGMRPSTGSRFGGGFFAGLLGAGLIGALLGGGFFGGLGGLSSMIGLLFQVGIVVLLAMLALRLFRRRSEPAGVGAPYARSNLDGQGPAGGYQPGGQGPAPGMFGGGQRPVQARSVQIGQADYQAFERLLGDIQDAYSREDRVSLGNLVTPEMAGYFDEELRNNAARGVINRISDVKLLQGDLSEAWGEDRTDYATVAMRFALKDVMVERGSGRVVQQESSEAVELWTFQRQPGRGWVLSAIQQQGR